MQIALDGPLQRPRAVGRVVPCLAEPGARRAGQLQRDLAVGQPAGETGDLDIDDRVHMPTVKPVEHNDLVQAVEEFGPEARPHDVHDRAAHRTRILPFRLGRQDLAAKVGRHDDHGVAEIDRAPMPVGEAPVVQHLQQQVEDVAMRLLDLVEQDHLIGPAAHRFRERPSLVVSDIARWGADEAGRGVLLHIFRHVDTDHRRLVVEQKRSERLGEFRLAHAGRAEEEEGADRTVRILEPRSCPADGVAHGGHRLLLADHPLAQRPLHVQQFLALALEHLVHGDTGPARDHAGDVG